MILIKNRQRKITVDTNELKNSAQIMITSLGYKDFDLSIVLTTNATIRSYNRTYRSINKATDILSFPYHPELKPGQPIIVHNPEDKNLGDIIISLEYVQKKAPFYKRTFKQHLTALLAHGIAHLLNYDHQTDKEFKIMHTIETQLLDAVNAISNKYKVRQKP